MENRIYKIDLDYEKDIFGYKPMETINYLLQKRPELIEVYFELNKTGNFNKDRIRLSKALILQRLELSSVFCREDRVIKFIKLS